jgi:ABC-type tungstate transport system permease subunit
MSPDTTYQVEFVSPSGTIPFTSKSEVLRADTYHDNSAPHKVSAATAETYGNPEALTTIRIGNGGLGPTGLLRSLCDAYLEEAGLGDHIKFEWVCNHSRHTQVALQAGVVDIGFTYEREEEARATSEGWAQTAGVFCHDHFVLAGPKADPADLASHHGVICSFNAIAKQGALFHTRGDGSATMHKEAELWDLVGVSDVDKAAAKWYQRIPGTPFQALVWANRDKAYLLTDRATFLTAKNKGVIEDLVTYVEGGEVLMNSCAVVLRSGEKRKSVWNFVNWLREGQAQGIISRYGVDWETRVPLFTPETQKELEEKCE